MLDTGLKIDNWLKRMFLTLFNQILLSKCMKHKTHRCVTQRQGRPHYFNILTNMQKNNIFPTLKIKFIKLTNAQHVK